MVVLICGDVRRYFFSYESGLIQRFFEVDVTHISSVIFSIFILFTCITGYDTYRLCKHGYSKSIVTRVNAGWFFSDALMTLGMLGTVAGFILMLEGDISVAKIALASMRSGMGVALYTTAAGVSTGLLLKLQLFNLSMYLENVQESTANEE